MKVIGFVGFKGSGKDTAASTLVHSHGFQCIAFADAVKDALAAIFCWPREMLEGKTPESRVWREQVDAWWAERLGIAGFNPRWAMQNFGTDIMRRHLHEDLWIMNVERKIEMLGPNARIVISDARFPNEINMIRNRGGALARIKRGDDPSWYDVAAAANGGDEAARAAMIASGVHASEWAWIGTPTDVTIENAGTFACLADQVEIFAERVTER